MPDGYCSLFAVMYTVHLKKKLDYKFNNTKLLWNECKQNRLVTNSV